MKVSIQSLVFLVSFLLLTAACKKDEVVFPPSTSPNKIMALGASRVEGNSPNFESYRYELWKDLIDGGWTFDFVGTVGDPFEYSDHSGNSFDPQHEGRGGWTSSQILAELNEWIEIGDVPDIVLFSSPGGNDGLVGESYSQAVSNVNAIVDILQSQNPNVTIIIEKMASAHSSAMTPELISFMSQMNQEVENIANSHATSTSTVLTVDMSTGFLDSYLADDVHYNQAGAIFVADRYYDVLITVLQ